MIPFPRALRSALLLRGHSRIQRLAHKLPQIDELYRTFHDLTDPQLISVFSDLQTLAHSGTYLKSLEARLFAVIKVAAERKVGLVTYDSQLLAALIPRRDHVVQMDTGEGKTLVAPFATTTANLSRCGTARPRRSGHQNSSEGASCYAAVP